VAWISLTAANQTGYSTKILDSPDSGGQPADKTSCRLSFKEVSAMYEGSIMETQGFSHAFGRSAAVLIPFIVPDPTRPQAVVGSQIVADDERQFDQRSLLRWADDGGHSRGA